MKGKLKPLFAIRVIHIILVSFLLVPSSVLAVTDGFQETVTWWQGVKTQVSGYGLKLQNLYSEAEALTPDKSKVNLAFCNELKRGYPGSTCNAGTLSGSMAVNGYTKVRFDGNWNIVSAVQTMGSLTKTYVFETPSPALNTFEITDGNNKIAFNLNLKAPDESFFKSSTIPAITASIQEVYRLRTPHKTRLSNPLVELLNDTYSSELSKQQGLRMDQVAERLVTDFIFRTTFLELASSIYQTTDFGKQGGDTSILDGAIGTLMGNSPSKTSVSSEAIKKMFSPVQALLSWIFKLLILAIFVKLLFAWFFGKQKTRFAGKLIRDIASEFSKGRNDHDSSGYESQDGLLSPAEQTFFEVLSKVIDQDKYHISLKPRLADLIRPKNNTKDREWWSHFGKIKSKHVDFAVMEKIDARIKGVIELDDASHRRYDRQKRDKFVDKALQQAGIPILHYPCLHKYDLRSLESALQADLGLVPVPFSNREPTKEEFTLVPCNI